MLESASSLPAFDRAIGAEPPSADTPWFLPRPPDLRARADSVLERGLVADTLLRPAQRENLRRMAVDLFERREVWSSAPVRLLYEFNRLCNVKCVHCDIRRSGTREQSVDDFERLLDDIGDGVAEVMPLVGGEPTLAPLEEAAAVCRPRGIWLNFITNGILFSAERFARFADTTARVQISFHSHDRARFERVMPGGHYDTVVKNLADAARIGRETGAHVLACIVPMHDMLDRLDEYVRFIADLGVDRMIVQNLYPFTRAKAAIEPPAMHSAHQRRAAFSRAHAEALRLGVHVETNVPELFGDPHNVPRARSRFDILQDTAHLVELYAPEFCISTAMQCVVEHDGAMLPCIRDRIPLGNVRRRAFRDVWNGPAMQRLRASHFRRAPRPNCITCRRFYLGHP